MELDLNRLGPADEPRTIAAAAAREAGLLGAGLIVGPIEPLVEQGVCRPDGRGVAAEDRARRQPGLGSGLGAGAALLLDALVSTVAERHELWLSSLNGATPMSSTRRS